MSKEANKEEFALRFGGGKNSENFLKSLGFPPSSIKRVQDEHTEGKYSVVVGNIDDRGEEIGDTFSSISVEYFPTEFFQAKKIN